MSRSRFALGSVNRRRRRRRRRASAIVLLVALISGIYQYVSSAKVHESSRSTQADLLVAAPSSPNLSNRSSLHVYGKVVSVADGDTITLLRNREQVKVRLLGIDAPEKSQPFGKVCREKLAALVAGKEVALDGDKRDQYGRYLGKIVLDGVDLNLRQVQIGCAWHYRQFARNQTLADRKLYQAAELQARSQRLGIWQDAKPQAPWDYRREKKSARRHSRSAN